jgi:hypothetical protein
MSELVEASIWQFATRSAIGDVLRHGVAAAIIFFYSKNILSAAVRAIISF